MANYSKEVKRIAEDAVENDWSLEGDNVRELAIGVADAFSADFDDVVDALQKAIDTETTKKRKAGG